MSIQFPSLFTYNLQQLVLTLNTVLLISVLICAELVYAERSKAERRQLNVFYPIVVVLGILLVVAVIQQVGKG